MILSMDLENGCLCGYLDFYTDRFSPMIKKIALLSPQLEAFMAVAKHKTVHAAARAIHLSQTAMTQRIHGLEQKINSTLFIRTWQGMKLSPEGEKLLRYCHAVADYSNE